LNSSRPWHRYTRASPHDLASIGLLALRLGFAALLGITTLRHIGWSIAAVVVGRWPPYPFFFVAARPCVAISQPRPAALRLPTTMRSRNES